jgi:prepilin-type N-terminal cleavage/methylation domain-containing protein/prepilin-type processing-associated H-X9-DG protein
MRPRTTNRPAFTLIELLVVISIIALLMAIVMPALGRAKNQCRATICRSNIRQLYLANSGYAIENDSFYVRAARDLYKLDNDSFSSGGMYRWHGVRQSDGVDPDPERNTFDPLKGPLRNYLGTGRIKECPAIIKFTKDGTENAFEAGCGGYGYNCVGVGSRTYQYGLGDKAMRGSMKTTEIRQPADKIMFTDTAFAQGLPPSYIIEYSFCEPPLFVVNFGNAIQEMPGVQPSIHFRHLGKSTVVWCDGHVSAEKVDFPESAKDKPEIFKIGWFGPEDNALFRPWN